MIRTNTRTNRTGPDNFRFNLFSIDVAITGKHIIAINNDIKEANFDPNKRTQSYQNKQ
jgi:hypothetical protein